MTDIKDDGGPAFPVFNAAGQCAVFSGMSLRDYFAAAALQGLLACPDSDGSLLSYSYAAYQYADAMLAARGKA